MRDPGLRLASCPMSATAPHPAAPPPDPGAGGPPTPAAGPSAGPLAAVRGLGGRGLALDVTIAVVLAGLLISNALVLRELLDPSLAPTTVTFVSGTAMCLLLAARRLAPLTVFVAVSVAFTVYGFNQGYDALGSSVALFLATLTAGSHGRAPWRDRVRAVVIAGLFGTIFYAFLTVDQQQAPLLAVWTGQAYTLVLNLFYFAAAWVLGDQVRLRREREVQLAARTAELSTRTLELETERERSAERAAVEERLRIARELHDVLGHHVSVMGVQAGAARRVLDRDRDASVDALVAIESSSRQAVTELQRVLQLLRAPADEGVGSLGALGRIEELAQELRGAGVQVTTQVDLARSLPIEVDLAAVRVVQESLTNVLRHAGPGTSAWVRVRDEAGTVHLEVADDGAGDPGAQAPGGGSGLRGMRERVELHGGRFDAGPAPPRGWQVRATLPVPDLDQAGSS